MLKPNQPVVFLHGFMGTSIMHFGHVLKHWYKKYPLMPIDLPGHGKSPIDASDNYYEFAMNTVIQKISKFESVNLIGASYLGGTIALRIALLYPNLINSLILTGFTYDIPKNAFLAWTNSFKNLAAKNPELAKEYQRLHGIRWGLTMDSLIEDCNRSYETTALITLKMMMKLTINTLMINGDLKQNEVQAALNINQLTPYLSGRIIKNAGHIVSHDQPYEFCQSIEKFWSLENVTV